MNQQKNYLERTTFFLGLLILASLISYLCLEIINKEKSPPALEVHSTFEPALPGNTFRIVVQNKGGETAKNVQISFNLYRNGQVVESAQMNTGYVPVHSEISGWISFSSKRKPADSLAVGAMNFLKP